VTGTVPELPEVEVARRVVADVLEGARVVRVHARDTLVAGGLEAVEGMRVDRAGRRGKWLRLELSGAERGATLVFAHLGMSGKWIAVGVDEAIVRHERARIEVVRGKTRAAVAYVDTRRLGRIRVAHEDTETWKALGPDVLDDGIDAGALHAALHAKRLTIKEALLDQRILAGVGNIHAIEALWRAQIDPRSRTDALTLADVRALARGVRASIAFGLAIYEREARAVYVNEAKGKNPYRVYERRGEPCPRCKTPLTKIVLGGRGTTFCSRCQRRIGAKRS
jgi:formamidopyrimidine-DNA glycosylase